MTEFEIGDLVYVKQELWAAGILVSRNPPVQQFRIGKAARVEYVSETDAPSMASIRMESDGEYLIVSTLWLGYWRDFATINEVEEYLDD